MITQKDLIVQYIKDYGSISPMEAFADLGITKLATRISEMQKDGVAILKKAETRANRYGKQVTYMRYSLKV